jgi:hypothetical protein
MNSPAAADPPPRRRLKSLRLSVGDIRWILREELEGPDDPDWRWLRTYGADGRDRAIELSATLAGQALDVRRLARYIRHHPGTFS